MAMLHIKHPRKKGFLYWDELGCLGKSLGFSSDVFYRNIPIDVKKSTRGIDHQTFLQMIDFHKYFHDSMDRSFNKHSDEWNLNVVKAVLPLLDQGSLSFTDIQTYRIAYQTYEGQDTRGLPTDNRTLLRTLKMCGRMISPIKMNRLLKAMSSVMEEPGRIQLHEFLQLILCCDPFKNPDLRLKEVDQRKINNIYKIDNMKVVLTPYDQNLYNKLDQKYLKNKWLSSKEKYGEPIISKDTPEVKTQRRYDLKQMSKEQGECLQKFVKAAQHNVKMARAGHTPPRPVSAPEFVSLKEAGFQEEDRPVSIKDFAKNFMRPSTAPCWKDGHVNEPEIQLHRSPAYAPKVTQSVIVTRKDIEAKAQDIEALRFDMATLTRKYQDQLNMDLQVMCPGYENRPRTCPVKVETETKDSNKEQSPTDDLRRASKVSHRLSLQKPQPPPMTHAKNCDARFRGWFATQTEKGKHYILVKSAFDKTKGSSVIAKLEAKEHAQLGRKDFITRKVANTSRTASGKQLIIPEHLKNPHMTRSTPDGTANRDRRTSSGNSKEVEFESPESETHPIEAEVQNNEFETTLDKIQSRAEKFETTRDTIQSRADKQNLHSNNNITTPSPCMSRPNSVNEQKVEFENTAVRSLTPHSNTNSNQSSSSPTFLSSAPSSASYNSIGIVIKDDIKKLSVVAPPWVNEVLKKPHLLSKSRPKSNLPRPLELAAKTRLMPPSHALSCL